MADTQNTIYTQAYSRNIQQLAQQKMSKLYDTVYIKPDVAGKTFFQDQIGQWSLSAKAGRNAQTPNSDPGLARRMGTMVDYHDAVLLDRGDELRSISDPRSAYTVSAASAIGRKWDDVIIAAAAASASSGETGSTSVTNGNIALVTAASLTLAMFTGIKKKLDDQDVPMEDRYIVVNTTILNNLLGLQQATSADYAAVKALVKGEIDTWLGFKWIMSTRLGTTNIGLAYHKTGICLGLSQAPFVRTDERKDLSYSWQIYYEISAGAVRLEENKVVLIREG